MPKIHVTGWRHCVERDSTTEVLRAHPGLGRAEATTLTDAILDRRELWLEVALDDAAKELAAALQVLGVDAAAEAGA